MICLYYNFKNKCVFNLKLWGSFSLLPSSTGVTKTVYTYVDLYYSFTLTLKLHVRNLFPIQELLK